MMLLSKFIVLLFSVACLSGAWNSEVEEMSYPTLARFVTSVNLLAVVVIIFA